MMDQAIKDFTQQLTYQPKINYPEKLGSYNKFLVCAMGGSALSTGLLQSVIKDVDLILHRNYDLPKQTAENLRERLVLCISYSGNTEEVLSAYALAKQKQLPIAVIAKGGRLIELAEADKVPYIKLPDTGIQPRNALGFTLRAQLALMKKNMELEEITAVTKNWKAENYEHMGRELAVHLKNKVPVIYSSEHNNFVGYIWKIKFNETSKIPAFNNSFPELNHNEMQGFEVAISTNELSKNFYFVFLVDSDDHTRIQKRMEITKKIFTEQGIVVENFQMEGLNRWHRIFSSLAVADWTAYYLATNYGVDPEKVALVEKLKQELG